MNQRWFPALVALLIVVFVVSCSGGVTPAVPTAAPAPTQASVATQAPKPTTPPAAATSVPTALPATPPAKATTAPTAAPAKATTPAAKAPFTRAQLDKIFPAGKGQDLVFQACNNCHNWVPLLIAQLNKDSWLQNKGGHKERVSGLSDADFDFLYDYLIANVNDKTPIPDNIPQELLDQWTSY